MKKIQENKCRQSYKNWHYKAKDFLNLIDGMDGKGNQNIIKIA